MFARKPCACEPGRGDGPGKPADGHRIGLRIPNRAADTDPEATPAGDRYGDYPAESV